MLERRATKNSWAVFLSSRDDAGSIGRPKGLDFTDQRTREVGALFREFWRFAKGPLQSVAEY